MTTTTKHHIERLRWEKRRRTLRVINITRLTPHMQRITFQSDELHDFASLAHDDHVKILLPIAGEADSFVTREYTPRYFDTQAGTLVLDFALHQHGPANAWAMQAKAGDTLIVSGPGKSMVVADDFDWYLLMGDATALPAITRRIEQLRAGVHATSIIMLADAADKQACVSAASWQAQWLLREHNSVSDEQALLAAAAAYQFPPGDGYIWIAAEKQAARALRSYMVEQRGQPEAWIKSSSYWTREEE
ncbi:siderophore-interacting protein [Undibacterium pigrum]|uniref:NADPH-dependent ferric siderophore reductase n=1 Tax=Undibacterium pigrum TaxID=401470 RepID=A0A318IVM8_9BURK|nr:siderophore-interacting protein [Undibacterium pigrum]PXX33731.1 NADPH-dependent ferric siderophore reductase [Undibacterium pigrum]